MKAEPEGDSEDVEAVTTCAHGASRQTMLK